jgi:hypothetical protein
MTQLGLFPPSRNRRVPELTEAMRLALAAIELCGGSPLVERRFRRPGRGTGMRFRGGCRSGYCGRG